MRYMYIIVKIDMSIIRQTYIQDGYNSTNAGMVLKVVLWTAYQGFINIRRTVSSGKRISC